MASIQFPQAMPQLKASHFHSHNLNTQNSDNLTFELDNRCIFNAATAQLPPLRSPHNHHDILPTSPEVATVPLTDALSTFSNTGPHGTFPRKPQNEASNTTSDVLRLMDGVSVSLSTDAYVSLIKECTFLRDPGGAIELHGHLRRSGLKPSLDLLNRVLLMFVSCGRVDVAENLFDGMPKRDFNSWAVLVVGYMECGDYEGAIRVFVRMCSCLSMSRTPAWLVACVLDACVNSKNGEVGEQIHGWLLKQGRYNEDLVFIALFKLYGRFHRLEYANSIFNRLSRYNTSIWTEKMLNDYRGGDFAEVVNDFKQLEKFGKGKSQITLSNVIKACGRINDGGEIGQQVHAKAIKVGMGEDEIVRSGLVGMYGNFGLLRDARMIFDALSDRRNIKCWNSIIEGYVQHGFPVEAIKLLYQMKVQGLEIEEHLLHKVRLAAGS